ncbi:MAG: dual specificity protein phosphatase family protein [Planctomycetes bacterium]|nr:dual specificity protein phosphatase family protein [Planctomycetota bacterium]
MDKKKQHWLMPLIAVAIAILVVGLVRHFHIKNFKCIEPGILYTSGQPRGMDYTRLFYKHNIATFVNIRLSAEHREEHWYNEEKIWMNKNNVNYIEIAIDRTERENTFPDKSQQQQFLEIMSSPLSWPVLVHGSSGRKRVSMMAAVWLIKERSYTPEEVFEVVEHIKEDAVTDAEKEFIRALAG